MNNERMIAAVYIRVSTEDQAREKFSLENKKKSYYNSMHLRGMKYLRFMKMQEYLQKIWNIDQHFKRCYKI